MKSNQFRGTTVEGHVTEVVTDWLLTRYETERFVSEEEYKKLEIELTPLMKAISNQWCMKLPGFEYEDLIGFCQLKLWKTLARDKYDYTKPAKQYFGQVFRNLMRTIAMRICSAEARGLAHEMLGTSAFQLDPDETTLRGSSSVLLDESTHILYVSTRKSTRLTRKI